MHPGGKFQRGIPLFDGGNFLRQGLGHARGHIRQDAPCSYDRNAHSSAPALSKLSLVTSPNTLAPGRATAMGASDQVALRHAGKPAVDENIEASHSSEASPCPLTPETPRLSQHQVFTRQPQAIESLGTVTVPCVDKTGTLTHNA